MPGFPAPPVSLTIKAMSLQGHGLQGPSRVAVTAVPFVALTFLTFLFSATKSQGHKWIPTLPKQAELFHN